MPPGKITRAKPSASSSLAGSIGVLPPSTMFAISGRPLPSVRDDAGEFVALPRRLDEQHVGAGLAIQRGARSMARSKPSTATASVRAMIERFARTRAHRPRR